MNLCVRNTMVHQTLFMKQRSWVKKLFSIENYLFKSFIVCAVTEVREQKYFPVIETKITLKMYGRLCSVDSSQIFFFFGRVKALPHVWFYLNWLYNSVDCDILCRNTCVCWAIELKLSAVNPLVPIKISNGPSVENPQADWLLGYLATVFHLHRL